MEDYLPVRHLRVHDALELPSFADAAEENASTAPEGSHAYRVDLQEARLRTSSGWVSADSGGHAASADRLATARRINGVLFDGSASIDSSLVWQPEGTDAPGVYTDFNALYDAFLLTKGLQTISIDAQYTADAFTVTMPARTGGGAYDFQNRAMFAPIGWVSLKWAAGCRISVGVYGVISFRDLMQLNESEDTNPVIEMGDWSILVLGWKTTVSNYTSGKAACVKFMSTASTTQPMLCLNGPRSIVFGSAGAPAIDVGANVNLEVVVGGAEAYVSKHCIKGTASSGLVWYFTPACIPASFSSPYAQSDFTGTLIFAGSSGGSSSGVRKITGAITIDLTAQVVQATTGTFNQPLPDATGCRGRVLTLKNSGSGTVTVTTTGGQVIDGGANHALTAGAAVTVQSDGTGWIIISAYL
jgi:hypothetical protein